MPRTPRRRTTRPSRRRDQPLTLDIRSDTEGEFFDVRLRWAAGVELDVLDLRRRDRHLGCFQTRPEGNGAAFR